MDYAVCPEVDGELFFAEKGDPVSSGAAKAICRGCLVIAECLAWALDNDETGVWGGTTETERRRMKRKPKSVSGVGLAA
ncbi:WhiB family transcriptional regulator [Microbispora sp. RL4-1S]|uniref:Transcriptional regulator WhiB n=2 Tax=Microbispora oryzae TaxID=2806554 RepID=A0A941AJM9_9ACTN|nr:WhiB family transcriptional regulator [Microbispora oryzae]